MNSSAKTCGFSLVTLSITLAVISVLATAVIPTLASTSRLPLMEATVAEIRDFSHMAKLLYATSPNATWPGADGTCTLINPGDYFITGETAFGTPIQFGVRLQAGLCTALLGFAAPAWSANFLARSLPMTTCSPSDGSDPEAEHDCVMGMMPPQNPGSVGGGG